MYEIAWVSPGLVNVMFGPCGEGCYLKMMLSRTNHITFWPRKVQFRQHRLNPFFCVRVVHREAGLGLENVWNWHVTNCNAERSLITKAYFCWWVTGRLQEVLPQKTLLKWILLPSQFFFSTGTFLGLASAMSRVIQGWFLIPSVEKELAYIQVLRFLHVSYNVGSLLNLQFMRFLPMSTFLSMPNAAELQATIKHQMFNIDC